MSAFSLSLHLLRPFALAASILGLTIHPASMVAQPVVSIRTVNATVSEAGTNAALFAISRRGGDMSQPLTVFYALEGTAVNGEDYVKLPGSLTIRMGMMEALLEVKPMDDALVEGTETVVVRLLTTPVSPYAVTTPSSATAYIEDNDTATNLPPVVRINSPTNGAVFRESAQIVIEAVSQDRDGYAPKAEFFANDKKIGEQEILFFRAPPPGTPVSFSLAWSNVNAGTYSLTAKTTDDRGGIAWSEPVKIAVLSSNAPPVIRPTVVTIQVVDGIATEIPPVPPGMGRPQMVDMAVFRVVRSGPTNLPLTVYYQVAGTAENGVDYEKLPGTVTIPAGATSEIIQVVPIDDALAEGTETIEIRLETPVCIAIYPPPPECYVLGQPASGTARLVDDEPAGDKLPIVNIVATDPYASEGVVVWTAEGVIGANPWCAGMGAESNVVWRTNAYVPAWVKTCPWGTNTATFAISRSGSTNAELAVYYSVTGTATPGLDYVELPGKVIIPAGRRSANITVMPLDDNLPEPLETVTLTLRVPTSDPTTPAVIPPYILGGSVRAAAFILDNDQPRPPARAMPDGFFYLGEPRTTNSCYRIEVSTDLNAWTAVFTNRVCDGAMHFVDTEADGYRYRFYRIVPVPCSESGE